MSDFRKYEQSFFDYNKFTETSHDLESLAIEEDCGKHMIRIRTYDFISFDRVHRNNLHQHDVYEMCLVLNGSGEYKYDGRKYHLKEGNLIIADPGHIHEILSLRTRDLYLVFLFFDIQSSDIPLTTRNEDILLSNFLNNHKILASDAELLFHYLPLLLAEKNDECSDRKLCKTITTKAWIFDCISKLTEAPEIKHETEKLNKNVDLAVSFIAQHIGEKFTLKDIAEHSYVSERHLRYLFQKHCNMSVSEYIQRGKIVYAENKLRMGVKIHDAAELVGIHNASQFSKLFKKINGITPRQYCNLFSRLK